MILRINRKNWKIKFGQSEDRKEMGGQNKSKKIKIRTMIRSRQ